jgi:alpha-tubulin suppressor-like RCC1 family protein
LIPVTGGLVHAIAAGWAHTCAITPEGGVQCWGNNDYGQLGDGTNKKSNLPVDVVGISGASNIIAGSHHTCVLSGNAVWCWGRNHMGQVGDGTTSDRNVPVQVLTGASNFTAGADYTCAIMNSGRVMCWGNNASGQLADGSKTNHTRPSPASLISGVAGVDGGENQTCAVTPAGLIACWRGDLIPVTGGTDAFSEQVAVNRFGTLIVGLDEQGTPITIQAGSSKEIDSLTGVIDVDSGLGHICALLSDGSVKCWGTNNYGQLGNDSTLNSQSPVPVADLAGASDMAVGRNHACSIITATAQETLIECWGLNTDGQLGDGSNNNSQAPVEVKITK